MTRDGSWPKPRILALARLGIMRAPWAKIAVTALLGLGLGCAGGANVAREPLDAGKLWVRPDPGILTPGANLRFSAVPEVHSEAPYIRSATWTVVEAGGGTIAAEGHGETAIYTAPSAPGTYHLLATTEFGTSRYVPQPGTVQVVPPESVQVSTSPSKIQIVKRYTGPSPKVFSTTTPITNVRCTWSIVEPGFEGPGLIQLLPDDLSQACVFLWDTDAALDRLPGTRFHIKAQSMEAPSAYGLVEVEVLR